jgi:hypothetical protein
MKRVVLACLFVIAPLAADAAGLRLVMRNGWVVPLTADGTQLAGEPQRLDLPQAAQGERLGIYSAKPDYATGRLYVVPQTPYAARGTVVYDLASYRRIDFLPGVTEVNIPADPEARTLYTRTWTLDQPPGDDTSLEYAMFEGVAKVTVEVRERRDASNVVARGDKTDWPVLGRCLLAHAKAYATSVPYALVDEKLATRKLPAAESMDARMRLLHEGSPEDCWANGDLLLALPSRSTMQYEGLDFSKPVVARRTAAGDYRRFVGNDTAWMIDRRYALRALGTNGRWAVLLTNGDSHIFDFATQGEHSTRATGNPYWAQLSADGQTLYLFALWYQSRGGGFDTLYIDGGATRSLAGALNRVTVAGDVPQGGAVALPKALTSIKDYYDRVDFIERNYVDDERRQQIEAIGPLGELGRKIGRVEIVGVIAD